jgi:decaprenyl-phosphate phosphoribosyltransferase
MQLYAPRTAEIWRDKAMSVRPYIKLARFDHWIKNIFVLPGVVLAYNWYGETSLAALAGDIMIALLLTGFAASANYTINEWLDAKTDAFHPVKKNRPSVSGQVTAGFVFLEWLLFAALSLGGAWLFGNLTLLCFLLALLVMGIVYNVEPMRSKDKAYLDVLSESINNPLRFLIGWSMIAQSVLPPSSVLLAYWMGGAFLMAVKRYSELRYIADPAQAVLYRKSFSQYTQTSLILSSFYYAMLCCFFLGVFIIKYRIELVLAMPLIAFLFIWYFAIGLREDSAAQRPEKLYREKAFMAYVAFLCVFVLAILVLELPWLQILVEPVYLSQPMEE